MRVYRSTTHQWIMRKVRRFAEYTIKIYGAKGHLYMQHTVRKADGWPLYGGEYLIDEAHRWTLDWAKGVAEKHFKENYKQVEQ